MLRRVKNYEVKPRDEAQGNKQTPSSLQLIVQVPGARGASKHVETNAANSVDLIDTVQEAVKRFSVQEVLFDAEKEKALASRKQLAKTLAEGAMMGESRMPTHTHTHPSADSLFRLHHCHEYPSGHNAIIACMGPDDASTT